MSERGVALSGKVVTGFSEILAKASRVDEIVAEIATASREQSDGISQINTAVSQMDKVTQNNAAGAEESAAAAEEMSSQAAILKGCVGELLGLISGTAAKEAPASPLAVTPTDNRSHRRIVSQAFPKPARNFS